MAGTGGWLFWARPWLWHHCDVILGMLVLILVRGDPWLYYGTNYIYLGVHFQVHRGLVTTPLGKKCYKKCLVRWGWYITCWRSWHDIKVEMWCNPTKQGTSDSSGKMRFQYQFKEHTFRFNLIPKSSSYTYFLRFDHLWKKRGIFRNWS